jgi:hypothetical protein
MARSTKVLAVITLAVSVVLVGVGGVASGAGARTNGLQGTSGSASVTSAKFNFSLSLNGLAGTAISLTGSGQIDFANDSVATSIVLPSSVAGLLGGGSVNTVISKGVLYLEVPGLGGLIGTPWTSLPLPSGSLVGAFSTIATALGNVNQIVSFASSHGATVTSNGSSTVDNSSVTYLISAGSSAFTLKATLWANSLGQLVQGVVDVASPSGGSSISITLDLSGYDAPITFTTPPPSQVTAIPLPLAQNFPGGMVTNAKPVKQLVGFTDSHLVKRGHHHRRRIAQ